MNWKKTVDWITFILNMLVALPFLGLISCGICYLAFYIMFPRAMDWLWIPVGILDIILIIFWGKYQYRILVLKVPRSPKETIRNLLLLAGCIAIVVLLILSFVTFWGAERMEKYIKNSYAERKFSHAEMIDSRYGIVLPFSIHENDIVKQTNDYIVVKTTSANKEKLYKLLASDRNYTAWQPLTGAGIFLPGLKIISGEYIFCAAKNVIQTQKKEVFIHKEKNEIIFLDIMDWSGY